MNYLKSCLLISLLCLLGATMQAQEPIAFSSKVEGEKRADGLELRWTTTAETKCTHFIIEKSKDGINFKTVATLPIRKNNTNPTYIYTDRSENASRVFYRLVEIGTDNKNAFSPAIVFSDKQNPKFELNKVIAIGDKAYEGQVYCHKAGQFNFRVMTNMGELLKEGNIPVQEGHNDIVITLDNIDLGTYMLALKLENDIEIFKLKKIASPTLSPDNWAKKQ